MNPLSVTFGDTSPGRRGLALPCVGTERFFQPQRRFILRHHLFFGPLLGLVEEAGGLFAGAEQFKVQRFIIRRGKHPLP